MSHKSDIQQNNIKQNDKSECYPVKRHNRMAYIGLNILDDILQNDTRHNGIQYMK